LQLLGRLADALDDLNESSAKVTPFRIIASADDDGQPTPEGFTATGSRWSRLCW
jgi:hypothetical protein